MANEGIMDRLDLVNAHVTQACVARSLESLSGAVVDRRMTWKRGPDAGSSRKRPGRAVCPLSGLMICGAAAERAGGGAVVGSGCSRFQ